MILSLAPQDLSTLVIFPKAPNYFVPLSVPPYTKTKSSDRTRYCLEHRSETLQCFQEPDYETEPGSL